MDDTAGTESVSYRTLLSDPALIAVILVSGTAAVGTNAVPVALPVVGETFALTESAIGLVMSVFTLAALVAIPVVSVLADVYGRRRVVIPSLVAFGLAGLATLGVSSFPALLALRAVQGVTFAGTLPLTPTLSGDLYTGVEGSSAQGLRSGMNGLANAVAPVVAGLLAVVAWQYPFVLMALTLPAAALVYRYYPEPVEPRTPADGESLRGEVAAYWRGVRGAADRQLGVYMAGGFTLFFLKGGFRTFLPVFVVVSVGAPVTAAGTLLGVYGAARLVVAPLSGSVMARVGRKRTMLLGTGFAGVGIGAIPAAPSLVLLGLTAVVYAAGEGLLNPVVNDAVAGAAVAEQRAGVMSGLQMLKNVALTVSPVLLGGIIGLAGYSAAFLLAAALAAAYAALVVVGHGPTAA